jgi:hypothetical protein
MAASYPARGPRRIDSGHDRYKFGGMSNATGDWQALPHGPLEKLSENLWRVSGSLPRMSLRRTMTIARLGGDRLVLHGAILLDGDTMKKLEALGAPAYLIVPNGFHRKDAPAYKRRYPGLTVLGPRGARPKIEKVIPLDGTLEDFPKDHAIRFEPLQGIGDIEGALVVRSADGLTVVLGDVVFNMDRKRDPLGFIFTTLFASAPGPRVTRLFKMLVKDRAALRRDLERLAALPGLTRLIVAHEKLAQGAEAAAALRTAATFL